MMQRGNSFDLQSVNRIQVKLNVLVHEVFMTVGRGGQLERVHRQQLPDMIGRKDSIVVLRAALGSG